MQSKRHSTFSIKLDSIITKDVSWVSEYANIQIYTDAQNLTHQCTQTHTCTFKYPYSQKPTQALILRHTGSMDMHRHTSYTWTHAHTHKGSLLCNRRQHTHTEIKNHT